jgi:putative aldouronate transport system permease protein
MLYKRSVGGVIFDIFNMILMALLFIIMVYPFLYVLNYSISVSSRTVGTLLLWPHGLDFRNYTTLLSDPALLQAMFISVARSLIGPFLELFVTGMAAYALATPNLVGGKIFRTIFILTMYLSAGLIPTYVFMRMYGLINSFWIYVLPSACGVFELILIRTYMESIPYAMREAVYMDGGNDFQAYWKVLFPICLPVNAAVLLFDILGQWNAYSDTQIYNTMAKKLYTLQYVLANIMTSQTSLETLKNSSSATTSQGMKMAMTVITVIPILFVYPSMQKYFVSGIMLGSVKE